METFDHFWSNPSLDSRDFHGIFYMDYMMFNWFFQVDLSKETTAMLSSIVMIVYPGNLSNAVLLFVSVVWLQLITYKHWLFRDFQVDMYTRWARPKTGYKLRV